MPAKLIEPDEPSPEWVDTLVRDGGSHPILPAADAKWPATAAGIIGGILAAAWIVGPFVQKRRMRE